MQLNSVFVVHVSISCDKCTAVTTIIKKQKSSITLQNCLVLPLCSHPIAHPQTLCAVPVVLPLPESDKNSPVMACMRGIFPFMAK